MSRPSMFAPGVGVAAAADGALWGVWPGAAVLEVPAANEPAVPAEATSPIPWNDLMRRYGRRVVVALLSQGVPVERAKELAQDAWLRVIDRHRAGLIPELSLPGLVITQASFLARDDLRRENRRAKLDEPRQQAARDGIVDLESQLDARARLRVVGSVLDQASPNAQRVFALLYGERALTPTEVAAELGLSVQRVRQIVCELRKRMRAALDDSGRNTR